MRAAFEGKLFAYLTILQHAQVTGSVTMISAASARAALPGSAGLAAVTYLIGATYVTGTTLPVDGGFTMA